MGWQFLRDRIAAGAGEFALTLIVFAVLVHITTGPGFGGAVTAAMRTAGGISAEIVSLAADTDPGVDVSDTVSGALMAGFVRDPYDTISWSQLVEGTGCADARDQALASGPHGFDDAPRQLMEAAGCPAQAGFNADATVGRLVGALLYLVVAAAALALFVVTAFTLVVAQGLALFLIALLPIALYAGLFPGAGRSLLWHWVAALVRVVALVAVMGPLHEQARLRPLFTALIEQTVARIYDRANRSSDRLPKPLLLVIDEAANIAPSPTSPRSPPPLAASASNSSPSGRTSPRSRPATAPSPRPSSTTTAPRSSSPASPTPPPSTTSADSSATRPPSRNPEPATPTDARPSPNPPDTGPSPPPPPSAAPTPEPGSSFTATSTLRGSSYARGSRIRDNGGMNAQV